MCIILLPQGHAKELTLGINLLSIHGFDRSRYFSNKIDSEGAAMYLKYIYLRYEDYYLVVGKDSIGSTTVGTMYEYNNFIIGLYTYNRSDWARVHQENSFGETLGFVPYLGYKVKLSNNINFIFNPILSTLNIEF